MESDPYRLISDAGKGARDGAEGRADLGPESCNSHHADHGDQADEDSVFDQGRALVVMAEAND